MRNKMLGQILTKDKMLAQKLTTFPTGVITLVANYSERCVAPIFMPEWAQYEKKQNKIPYKNIDMEKLWERYRDAIKEVKNMLIFPEVRNYYPDTIEVVNFSQAYRGETKVSKDPIPLGKFTITKNLMNYIEAIHDVPAAFIIKEVAEMGKYGLVVQLRFKDQRKPTNIWVVYNIEVEE